MDALRAASSSTASALSAAVAEVDLSALTHNLDVVRRHVAPGAEVDRKSVV